MAPPRTTSASGRMPQVEPIDIPLFSTPWLDAMRRGLDRTRSFTGRAATVAGTAAAVAVMTHPFLVGETLVGDVVVTAAGVGVLRLAMPHRGHQKETASVLYAVPGAALAALLLGEGLAAHAGGGARLAEVAAIVVWTGGTFVLRPARHARHMVSARPPKRATAMVHLAPTPAAAHPACTWWGEHAAAPGGSAEDTVLEEVVRTGEYGMTATIRAIRPGKAVPDISIKDLSALMDVPEDDITIGPVPGRGAGVRRLTIGHADTTAGKDPATVWAEQIAPVAMPGVVLTGIRVGRPGTPPPVEAVPAPEPAYAASSTAPDAPGEEG
jgi:hypothetical protein